MIEDELIQYALELQSLAQAGLYYGKDKFDKERYQRIREIAGEILSKKTDFSYDEVMNIFCSDQGYQTPKLDTRAAIFKENKILLVKEADGRWALPGGWCEFNLSPVQNTIKEAKEEAGRDIHVKSLIAVHNRNFHNPKPYFFGVIKMFFLCEEIGGEFQANIETIDCAYFAQNEVPDNLASEKCCKEQIDLCFEASLSQNWVVPFD